MIPIITKTSVTTFQQVNKICLLSLNLNDYNSITHLNWQTQSLSKLTAFKVPSSWLFNLFLGIFSLSFFVAISFFLSLVFIWNRLSSLTLALVFSEELASKADLVKKLIFVMFNFEFMIFSFASFCLTRFTWKVSISLYWPFGLAKLVILVQKSSYDSFEKTWS